MPGGSKNTEIVTPQDSKSCYNTDMRNFLKNMSIMLDLFGRLVVTAILTTLGAAVLLISAPVLAMIVDADDLAKSLEEAR